MSFHRDGEELEVMDRLVALTGKQLDSQRLLREQMAKFKAQQDAFYKGDQSKEMLSKMVETAAQILKEIEENHYENMFSIIYMQELKMFTAIAKKNSPARP